MSSEVKSFNIAAIQVFDYCALHIRKVLSKKWYFFTQQYILDKNQETIIENESYNVPANFFDDKISIQAIVGMNGSGKSCILECVFRIINNISYQILHKIQRHDSHELVPVDGIYAEVYFSFGGDLISVGCDKNSYYYRKDGVKKNILDNGSINDITAENKKFLSEFCYTIVCNYSQHAYNALTLPKKEYYIDKETNTKRIWLNGLFHKNDGYLTPIVLNPYRVDGNINFNTENYLANVRLASLFIALKEKNIDLIDGYEAVKIRFTYNSKHFRKSFNNLKNRWTKTANGILTFDELSDEILNLYNIDKIETNKYFIKIGYQYLVYKTLTILEKYPSYSNSYDFSPETCLDDGKDKFLINLEREISRIKGEDSHITLKVKQVLNYINNSENLKKVTTISLNEYINKPSTFTKLSRVDQIITEFLPSFFSIDTVLYKNTDKKRKDPIPFESMSSGERQFLVVMASVMYHLKNINSIPNKATLRIKYKYSHPSDDIDNVLGSINDTKIKLIKYILLKIKDNLTLLIKMKPDKIAIFIKNNRDKILKYASLEVGVVNNKGKLVKEKLGNIVLGCLRYEVYRESLLLRLADFLNIRCCPYCNAAFTLYIEGKEEKYDEKNALSECNVRRAMFQFDHYFPKEKFPIFSISFYNLIPSCACCNQKKSKTEVAYPIEFNPHIGSISKYFHFKMDEGSSLSLWKGKVPEKFELKMVAGNSVDQSDIDKYNRQYNIVLQYNRFTHEVYELYKNEYSHKHYKDILDKIPDKDLQTLFIAKDTIESIERTPLSKLKSDIKKQIKEDNIL